MQINEPLSLSPDEALSTSIYLKETAARSRSMGLAVQTLFARCCLSALPGCRRETGRLGEEADSLAQCILQHPHPETLDLDPLLLIELYRTLNEAGIEVASLRSVVQRIASDLSSQPAEVQCVGRVRRMAARLKSLGFAVKVSKPSKPMAALVASPEAWFGASAAELAELADHLTADDNELTEIPSRILALVALAELRNYRIDLGCALLRVAFQFGEPSAESVDALNFIALQRRRDGRYGFPNLFTESVESGRDQHLSLYLPLTVNAVWLFCLAARYRRQSVAAAVA